MKQSKVQTDLQAAAEERRQGLRELLQGFRQARVSKVAQHIANESQTKQHIESLNSRETFTQSIEADISPEPPPIEANETPVEKNFAEEVQPKEQFHNLEVFLSNFGSEIIHLSEIEKETLARSMAKVLYEKISSGYLEEFCKNFIANYIRGKISADHQPTFGKE